jgi:hypothetical protein
MSGFAWATEYQNASTVCPERVRPLRSTIGAGDPHRNPLARGLEHFLDGEERRFRVQRVEDRLDEEQVGAAIDQAVRGLGVRRAQLIEGDIAVAGIRTRPATARRSG